MAMLKRDDIMKCDDLPEAVVECPEWGGEVKVKALSLDKRQEISRASEVGNGLDSIKLAVVTFIEGVIEPKFTAADFEVLKSKSSSAMNRVVNKICELSGIGQDLKKELKATD